MLLPGHRAVAAVALGVVVVAPFLACAAFGGEPAAEEKDAAVAQADGRGNESGDGGVVAVDPPEPDANFPWDNPTGRRTSAPGFVSCSDNLCDVDAGMLCCVDNNREPDPIGFCDESTACTDDKSARLECDEAADCNTGEVCCFTIDADNDYVAACVAAAACTTTRLCKTDKECGDVKCEQPTACDKDKTGYWTCGGLCP